MQMLSHVERSSKYPRNVYCRGIFEWNKPFTTKSRNITEKILYTDNIVNQVDKNKNLTYGLWNMWYGNKRDSYEFKKNVIK